MAMSVMAPVNYVNILAGDTAPLFSQRSGSNPRFVFDTAGGRYLVLCFMVAAGDAHAAAALAAVYSDIVTEFRVVQGFNLDRRQAILNQALTRALHGFKSSGNGTD